jgi:DNA-binding transcriptional LysR family regulator
MDRLDAMRAFVVAVDRGSLAATAKVVGVSPASVTRAIDALEERLGTTLLRRTTRSLKLTDAGERYLVVARRVLADLDEAERMSESQTAPHGVLTVTAPIAFGSMHVRPVIDDFVAANAEVRARLLLLDRVVGLVEEGIDVAVRIGHLPDSALIAASVGHVQRVVVASPRYLAEHGKPKTPADLAAHRVVASTVVTPHETWTFGARRVKVTPVISANTAEAAVASAIGGAGVTCAISYQVAEHLASGALVRVLGAYEPPPVPVHVVYPAASGRVGKVRAFVEMVAPRLRALLRTSYRSKSSA